jgi:hypothetical protein
VERLLLGEELRAFASQHKKRSIKYMALLSTKTGLPSFSAQDASIVNYFTDPGFERGTNAQIPAGWVQYNDGAVAIPVDGTGGSANANVTLVVTDSSPIRGTKSALFTKLAGNQQGTGFSFPFTISNVDKGVTAGVDFEMVTSAAYASGDAVFYIYDVTNSILITPRAVALPKLDNFGRFFTDYGLQTGTSYRFILHIATTNASAWTITLDTMVNSTTRTAVPGAIVGKTRDVTVSGTWVTNTTYAAKETQTGQWAQYDIKVSLTGAPTATSLIITMPAGRTIDTALLANSVFTAGNGLPGQKVTIIDTGTATYDGMAGLVSATTIQITYLDASAIYQGVTQAAPMTFANGDSITISFRVPIVEFSGSESYSSGSITQWASDDGTSDVLGPQGSLVPNVGFGTGTTTRVLSFSIPQDLRQFVRVEYNRSGNGWGAASDLYPFSAGNNAGTTNFYGIRGEWTSATNFQVSFGNQGTRVNSSAVSNGTDSWATEFSGGSRFRVGLSIGGVFVGVNLAQGNFPGFYQAGFAPGLTTGATIGAGYVGERISTSPSNVTLTTANVVYNAATLSLTAGVWMVFGKVSFGTAGTTQVQCIAGISETSATLANTHIVIDNSTGIANARHLHPAPYYVNTNASKTMYLLARSDFTGTAPSTDGVSTLFYAVRIA